MSATPTVDQSNGTPFRARGAMQTAHPDYRHYTTREYGTQVGYYQLLDAFAKAGVTASIATNAASTNVRRLRECRVVVGSTFLNNTDLGCFQGPFNYATLT